MSASIAPILSIGCLKTNKDMSDIFDSITNQYRLRIIKEDNPSKDSPDYPCHTIQRKVAHSGAEDARIEIQ